MLIKQREILENETEIIVRDEGSISDYLYELNTEFIRKESAANFDNIDIVYIIGDQKIMPWDKRYLKEFTVVNRKEKGKILKINEIEVPLNTLTHQDYYLDTITGDLYNYNQLRGEWYATLNCGIHNEEDAHQYSTLGKYVTNAPVYKTKPLDDRKDLYYVRNFEILISIKTMHLNHHLFADIEKDFKVGFTSHWLVHSFAVRNQDKKFRVLAESPKGPSIIQLNEEIIGTQFEINTKYPTTLSLLKNFTITALRYLANNCKSSKIGITEFYNYSFQPLYSQIRDLSNHGRGVTIFKHSGFSAKKGYMNAEFENNAVQDKLQSEGLSNLPKKNKKHFDFSQSRSQINASNLEANPYSISSNFLKTQEYKLEAHRQEVRKMLHPNIEIQSKACTKKPIRIQSSKPNSGRESERDRIFSSCSSRGFSAMKSIYKKFEKEKTQEDERDIFLFSGVPYVTEDEIYKRDWQDRNDKALAGKSFKINRVPNDKQRMISNYVRMTPSKPPSDHKFREELRNKWVGPAFNPF